MELADETALCLRLRARDPAAMEILYTACGRRAFGLAYSVVGEASAAEEVVQDGFLSLWRHVDHLDPGRGSLVTLLLTIVYHRAIDRIRVRRAKPEAALDMDDPSPLDTEQLALRAVERSDVREALAQLPAEQRQTLELSYFDGYSHSEIARITGSRLGTVKSRVRLGLEHLRTILREKARA